jgi:hypothetical protein
VILTHRSGFALTDADGHEVVHVLPCRLWIPGGAYGDVETLFRSVALDQTTIHVEQFTGGAEELQGRIRFHGDPAALRALLREGARGRTLTYYPDLAVPAEAYPVVLMDAGAVVQVAMDGARAAYGEWEVPVTLRRVDGGSLAPLASGLLIELGPAGPMTGATFTRATAGTRISAARRIESIAAGLRRVTWLEVNGVLRPFALCELARDQVAANPQAPNSWSDAGTPGVTPGITDPFGGAAAILLEDNDAAGDEGRYTVCAFTGNGTKAYAVIVSAGTLGTIRCQAYDAMAAVTRHQVTVTFNGGTTAPTLATSAGAGTIFTPVALYDSTGRLWWVIRFSASGVIAANTNQLFALSGPTGSDVGTFYLAGANAWDATYPSSWQGPTLGTRNGDQWTVPYPHGPLAATYAVRFVERGAPPWVGGTSPRVFQLGAAAGSSPSLLIAKASGASTYLASHATALGESNSTIALAPTPGDLIELMLELFADGSVLLHGRKNGGAVVSDSGPGAVVPLAPAWSDDVLHLGSVGAGGGADIGFGGLIAQRGTGHDFARLVARIPGAPWQ